MSVSGTSRVRYNTEMQSPRQDPMPSLSSREHPTKALPELCRALFLPCLVARTLLSVKPGLLFPLSTLAGHNPPHDNPTLNSAATPHAVGHQHPIPLMLRTSLRSVRALGTRPAAQWQVSAAAVAARRAAMSASAQVRIKKQSFFFFSRVFCIGDIGHAAVGGPVPCVSMALV